MAPDPDDVIEPKARAALGRFRIEPAGADRFDEVHALLDAEFGPRGEIERAEVLRAALRRDAPPTYHLYGAWDEDGRLAGARDCWVSPGDDVTVVYLAHSLVRPEWRRTGLAGLLRAVPATLGRRAATPGSDVLLALEQEFARPEEPDTLVRLVAYGRAGYAAIPPDVLPYCQPDFRDLEALGEPARPIPLVAVVRWLDHDGADAIPARLAAAYVERLYGIFGTHCRASDLAPAREHALATLAASGLDPVPLLRMPASLEDAAAIGRLGRSWSGSS